MGGKLGVGEEDIFWNSLVSLREKAMAPHSSTLAWKIPWTEEPGRLQSMGSLGVGQDWVTSLSLSLSCIGGENGNPLQCSCLENPRDRGAWWAAVYGVAQSRTWLKRFSSMHTMMYSLGHRPPLFYIPVYCYLLSCVRLFAWTHQAPLSVEFSGQEYWSGLPCPPLGDLPTQRSNWVSYVSCIGRRVLYH